MCGLELVTGGERVCKFLTPSWLPGLQSRVHFYSFLSQPAHGSQHVVCTPSLFHGNLVQCFSACLPPTSFHIVSSIEKLPGQCMWFVVEELMAVDVCPPLHFCALASSVNSGLACGSATVLGAGHASVRKMSLLLWMLRCNAREPAGNCHLEKHVLSNSDEYYRETGCWCSGDTMVRGAQQPQVGNPESRRKTFAKASRDLPRR